MYLAVFIDLFSRRVVGWTLGERLTAELVLRALKQAILIRRPPPGLVIHTDRGSQYTSDAFIALLQQGQLTPSMSRKGNCWDNAVVESFFATLKCPVCGIRHTKARTDRRGGYQLSIPTPRDDHRLHRQVL